MFEYWNFDVIVGAIPNVWQGVARLLCNDVDPIAIKLNATAL